MPGWWRGWRMTMCVERKEQRLGSAQHGRVGGREQQTRQEFLEIVCPDGVKNGISWPLLLRAHAFLLLPPLWVSQGPGHKASFSCIHRGVLYILTRQKSDFQKIPNTKTKILVNLESKTKNSSLAKEEKTASNPRKFLVTRRLYSLLPLLLSLFSPRRRVPPPHHHFLRGHASKHGPRQKE